MAKKTKQERVVIQYFDVFGRLINVMWTFQVSLNETVILPFMSNIEARVDCIIPYKSSKDLYVTKITVNELDQITDPIPLRAFENYFAMPKTDDARPGELIIIEIKRIKNK